MWKWNKVLFNNEHVASMLIVVLRLEWTLEKEVSLYSALFVEVVGNTEPLRYQTVWQCEFLCNMVYQYITIYVSFEMKLLWIFSLKYPLSDTYLDYFQTDMTTWSSWTESVSLWLLLLKNHLINVPKKLETHFRNHPV
jgi:hypothetical protein